MLPAVSPKKIAASLDELWSPRVVAELDDSYVKVAKVKGMLAWHSHDTEDEWRRERRHGQDALAARSTAPGRLSRGARKF